MQTLNFGETNPTDNQVRKMLSYCPNITTLMISGCDEVTDQIMPEISKLRRLKRLDLTFCNITDAGLNTLPSLDSINLTGCEITDDGLTKLQCLKQIDVRCCGRLTKNGVTGFKNTHPHIELSETITKVQSIIEDLDWWEALN